jgi:hypothetical protein
VSALQVLEVLCITRLKYPTGLLLTPNFIACRLVASSLK